jgi:hypothetical protein
MRSVFNMLIESTLMLSFFKSQNIKKKKEEEEEENEIHLCFSDLIVIVEGREPILKLNSL